MAENPRIEELRRRVLADPASIAFAALAEEFRRVGRYEEAIETCRTGLQRHPAYLSARVTLGRALIETGDYDGAREQLETVLRSAPENLAAIRGIAQIDERLGHSAEMDPHLADMMQTHAESLRAAAERVPVVSEPPPVAAYPDAAIIPEPQAQIAETSLGQESSPFPVAAEPELPPAPRAPLANEPKPEPAVKTDAPVDVFASFASAPATHAGAPDLSFDLSTAFSIPQKADRPAEAPIDFSTPPPAAGSVADPVAEPTAEVFDCWASPPAAQAEPVFQVEQAFESEPEPAVPAGPDPEILATLARLERFLGAIQSLRA